MSEWICTKNKKWTQSSARSSRPRTRRRLPRCFRAKRTKAAQIAGKGRRDGHPSTSAALSASAAVGFIAKWARTSAKSSPSIWISGSRKTSRNARPGETVALTSAFFLAETHPPRTWPVTGTDVV